MRCSSNEAGSKNEPPVLVLTSLRLALISLVMTSVLAGCRPPGEDSPPPKAPSPPPTTIELIRAGDARACVAADVLEKLQGEVRGERRLYFADKMRQAARRQYIGVTFEELTATKVDATSGVIECEGMLVATTPDHSQRERTSFKVSLLAAGDGIVVRANPAPAPAVKQIADWSPYDLERVYRELRMQDALARSNALPPALRTRYLETLDDCDEGATPEQCTSGLYGFIEEVTAAGWCQRTGDELADRVPWHRCGKNSLKETEVE